MHSASHSASLSASKVVPATERSTRSALDPESPGSPGGTLLEEQSVAATEEGDHERFAHYANKNKITESAVTGEPVIALCGKVWVPGRDPRRFPVCPDCRRIYDQLPRA